MVSVWVCSECVSMCDGYMVGNAREHMDDVSGRRLIFDDYLLISVFVSWCVRVCVCGCVIV